jgi:hypothetical protein
MNAKKCKMLRPYAVGFGGWRSRRYNRLHLRPVPPAPQAEDGFHFKQVGTSKDGVPQWFPITNPIVLAPDCGRAFYKKLKREARHGKPHPVLQ